MSLLTRTAVAHISVIIPARNEADRIVETLARVHDQSPPFDVTVVDGGSADDTRSLAAPLARVLESPPGRAVQMNHGAATTDGPLLFFLHADTLIPPHTFDHIREVMADPDTEGGAFRLAFDQETPLLRFYSRCTRFRFPSICFGDRGLFVRRKTFDYLGGFAEVPIFEDLEMVRALYLRGGFRFMDEALTTAARRFEAQGPLRQQLRNLLLWTGYRLGAPPEFLAQYYRYEA